MYIYFSSYKTQFQAWGGEDLRLLWILTKTLKSGITFLLSSTFFFLVAASWRKNIIPVSEWYFIYWTSEYALIDMPIKSMFWLCTFSVGVEPWDSVYRLCLWTERFISVYAEELLPQYYSMWLGDDPRFLQYFAMLCTLAWKWMPLRFISE